MMPPVEVPTIKSKCSTIEQPKSSSSPASTAAAKIPLTPPPSIERTWNRSAPADGAYDSVGEGEAGIAQLYQLRYTEPARARPSAPLIRRGYATRVPGKPTATRRAAACHVP